ncbi:MAG TPA: DNRLRE domain-containing protein, partial [Gaiellaceae bacterium]|nr:DNRLRE domain-containing protein [Gaiellaceae bacterium]
IESAPAARTDEQDATFVFSAIGRNLTYECSLDGGAWSVCSSPKTYRGLPMAPHTFEVRVLVPEADPEPPITLHAWTITELDPPETTIVFGPDPAVPSISTSATFAIQSDEAASTFECSLDNAGFEPCPDPTVYTGLADGLHTLEARATDAAGNVDATPASWTWTVAADRTAPTTTLLDHPDAETTSVDAGFTFVSNEPGSTFECALDTASLASCESPIAYTDLTLGEHTFRIRATDVHGNVEALQSYTWNVILDTVPPETTLQGRPPLTTMETTANFSFVASELDATFECSLDGDPLAECDSPMEYTDLAVGPHTFEVRAVDLAGNADQSPESYAWTVEAIPDTEAPEARILTHPADPSPSIVASFTFASEAGATFECSLDGEPFAECESPEEYEVEPGDHTFEVRATDLALNVGTPARYEWTVLAPPETTLVQSPAETSASTTATFEFSSDQPGVEFFCEIDGLGVSLCASPKTYTGLADGEHTFTVAAKNATYGLADETPVEYTWTVAVPPNTTILEKPQSSTTATSATFTFNANEADSAFECALDAAAWADCESPMSYTALAPGPHTFQVRAIDGAGNVDPSADSYSWTITDGTPPETTISGKPSDPSTLSSATFTFGGTDNLDSAADLRYECRFDGDAEFTACTSPKTYTGLATGAPYTFDVRAVDRAGNADPTPATWTWRVVAPDCTSVQTVGANADAWIESKSPSNNHGGDSVLKVVSKSGENSRALVRFPSPTVPSGCVVQSATLRMYAGGYVDGRTLQALQLAAGWSESGVNWSNQPTTTGTAATTASGQGYRSWDVTAQMAAMGANNNGFLIRDLSESNGGSEQQLHSREKSDNQPQMVYRFAAAAGSAMSCGAQQTVGANADAWIDQGSPSANKGLDAPLKIISKGPANNARALVRFSLPALPAGCAVESATLRLHLNSLTSDRVLEAWRVTGSWSEGGVTWDNQPATAGDPATTMSGLGAGATPGWREWNVSAQAVAMYAAANNGFLVKDAGDNNGGSEQQVASRESAMNRPELVIRFAAPDTRPPATTIDTGPSGTVSATSATFTFSSNEQAATFECALDGAAFAACASPKTYSSLSIGAHTLSVRATDAAGNVDATPASRGWTVELAPDLAPPDTGILTKPSNPSPTHSPSFTFTGTDDSTPASQLTYECKLDAGAFAPCASPKSYVGLAHGSHTFQVRATDFAGRVDPSPASYTWMVDLVPPETTINTGPSGTTTSTTETFTFSADDAAATFECSLDSAPWAACSSPRHLSGITAGPHTFRVRAIDSAGNPDPSSASRTWTANVSSCIAGTATVNPVADSWVLQSDAAKNNGADSVLKVDSKSGGNARALVRFNLPTLPAGCDVVTAKLRLYAASYKDGRTLQAIPLAAAWTENLVTWGNQPLTTGTAATTPSGFGYRDWTVTTQVQGMYAPGANHGFLIRDATENGGGMDQAFNSREKLTDNPPQLVVSYD